MLVKVLLGAVFLQVALTFALLLWLGRARAVAAGRGEVRLKDVALSSEAWSDRIKQVANAFNNQLELPVLFYFGALLAIVMGVVDHAVVGLAWLFVVLRLVHAYIHVTHNNVLRRFQAYVAGFMVLAALWIYIAVQVLASGSA